MGVVLIAMGDMEPDVYPMMKGGGIAIVTVAAVCVFATWTLNAVAKCKENQFRATAKEELKAGLLEEARMIAVERIRAAREAREIHVVV